MTIKTGNRPAKEMPDNKSPPKPLSISAGVAGFVKEPRKISLPESPGDGISPVAETAGSRPEAIVGHGVGAEFNFPEESEEWPSKPCGKAALDEFGGASRREVKDEALDLGKEFLDNCPWDKDFPWYKSLHKSSLIFRPFSADFFASFSQAFRF